MAACSRCGEELEAGSLFCGNCGLHVEASGPAPVKSLPPLPPEATNRRGDHTLKPAGISLNNIPGDSSGSRL